MGKKVTTEEWIERAKAVHGDTYGYEKSIYVRSYEALIITCKIHGDFLKRPDSHLSNQGCKKMWLGKVCHSKKIY